MKAVVFFCALVVGFAQVAQAQQSVDQRARLGSVVIIDTDQLFRATLMGQRLTAEFDAREAALRAENAKITQALTQEEQSLTQRRDSMDADVFRTEAAEFDARVQSIRRSREAASAKYESDREAAPRQFMIVVRNILGNMMVERGAVAILDKRVVYLSLDSADITADAIARIDSLIGDGAAAPEN